MATVAHTIRSDYDPADREALERETGQQTSDQSVDPWQTSESSFFAQRRIRAPPLFVPATISYDERGVHTAPSENLPDKPSSLTAEWYRSLTTASSRAAPTTRPSSAPGPGVDVQDASQRPLRTSLVTKNDWFIRKALRSEPSTKTSSPAPSLADLLLRDPPPLPFEERYTPPVWLHIGPSNRGFGMLQRSGWSEGEGLGAHVVRAGPSGRAPSKVKAESDPQVDVQTTRTGQVIDLTLSDSSEDDDDDDDEESVQLQPSPRETMQTSLLTPLPTVLKADRLGIGLKPKTEGPYKRSKKRVTHNAAALAAHIKSAEELRRKKAAFGKGRQGFARVHKKEEDRRKAMLAYLND